VDEVKKVRILAHVSAGRKFTLWSSVQPAESMETHAKRLQAAGVSPLPPGSLSAASRNDE